MNRKIFLRNTGLAIASAWVIPLATGCCVETLNLITGNPERMQKAIQEEP